MNPTFKILTIDVAIEVVQKLKQVNPCQKIKICVIDFDHGSESVKVCSPDEACLLICQSRTVIFNNDEYIPHMELFSTHIRDVRNIIPKGIMHDIIWTGK